MKIKLLSREFDVVLMDFSPKDNDGVSTYYDRQIHVKKGRQPFRVFWHEVAHQWINYTGQHKQESFNEEEVCDLISHVIDQLVIENGIGIFEKMHEEPDATI